MELQNLASIPWNNNNSANLAICQVYYDLSNTVNNQIGNQDLIWIDNPIYLHGSLIEQQTSLEVHYEMAVIDASV